MGFLKSLFGVTDETEESKAQGGSKDFDILKYDGIRALKQGDVAFAVKCFQHALEIKDEAETREQLAVALGNGGDYEGSMKQYAMLAELEPGNAPLVLRLAQMAYLAGKYEDVVATCARVLEIEPSNSMASLLQARAYMEQGSIIQAIAMLTKAITLDSAKQYTVSCQAWLLRGGLLLKMGDLDGAFADARKAVEQMAEPDEAYLLMARVAEAQGRHDDAINAYDKVVELNPFCVEAFKERGAVKYAMGDKNGAEDDMRQVLEIAPDALGDTNGEFTAEGREGIQCKVEQAYRDINPLGI